MLETSKVIYQYVITYLYSKRMWLHIQALILTLIPLLAKDLGIADAYLIPSDSTRDFNKMAAVPLKKTNTHFINLIMQIQGLL